MKFPLKTLRRFIQEEVQRNMRLSAGIIPMGAGGDTHVSTLPQGLGDETEQEAEEKDGKEQEAEEVQFTRRHPRAR